MEGAVALIPLKLLVVSLDSRETYAVCCDTWVIGYTSYLSQIFLMLKKKGIYVASSFQNYRLGFIIFRRNVIRDFSFTESFH